MAKKAGRKANGEGSIYYDAKRKRWVAEILWYDRGGKEHVKNKSLLKQN